MSLAIVMAGCGGSGGSGNPGGGGGTGTQVTPRVSIAWPERPRNFVAPASALSASIVLEDAAADGSDFSFQVDRPEGAQASTQTYPAPGTVRSGTYIATVRFHAATNATGDVVGVASATVRVAADGTLRRPDGSDLGPVGFNGTIERIAIESGQAVGEDEKVDLAVSAYGEDNRLLTLAPGSARLEVVLGGDKLRVNTDGTVTGLASGSATVIARLDGKSSEPTEVKVLLATMTPRSVAVPTKTMVSDPVRGLLWATIPSSSQMGNSVVDINPATGTVGTPFFVGSEPGAMAISDDASTLFVGLDGARSIRPVNLETRTPGTAFLLSNQFNDQLYAVDIEVQPGSKSVVAVTTANVASSGTYGPAIYDNGVRRPNMLWVYDGYVLVWTSPTRLITSGHELGEVSVDANGATKIRSVSDSLGSSTSPVRSEGRIYGTDGAVIDENTLARAGTFARPGNAFGGAWVGPVVDAASHLAYFLEVRTNVAMLHLYDTNSFLQVGTAQLNGVALTTSPYDQNLTSMAKWGQNGLAIRTTDRIYFVDALPRP